MKLLFFVTKSYSISILDPIEEYCKSISGINIAWFITGITINTDFKSLILKSSQEVINYNPDAVIVPGNVVPHFWPGVKVQIFHGLCEEKKGHYNITGFFDLYCTPGPIMTEKFKVLQKKYNTFLVRETGWPKLDNVIKEKFILEKKKIKSIDCSRKTILYAPTFSPKYQSSEILFESIKKAQKYNFNWWIKFHDLEKKSTIEKYKTLRSDFFHIIKNDNILQYMKGTDILLSDTSSVVYEFLLFDRPIITFNAKTRLEKGINIINRNDLVGAITRSIEDPDEYIKPRNEILNDIHPYIDGKSSERVINTIFKVIKNKELEKLRSKPRNWYRKMQIKKLVHF